MESSVIFWLVTALVLGIVEGCTVALVSIWLAIGAVAASVTAALGGSLLLQVIVFLVVSAILLAATVPLVKKMRYKRYEKTNADRMIGAQGVVIQRIDAIDKRGQIKVMGQIWSAVSEDESDIEIGERVVVEAIEGVRAVVRVVRG